MANRGPLEEQLDLDFVDSGIEPEIPGEPPEPHPWDPDAIRVDPKMFSLKNAYDWIEDGSIDVAPDFQRNFVWTEVQQTKLIESLLLRIPLPTFYLAADEEGLLKVVDGVRRMTTIRDFINNKFALSPRGLQYLKQVSGKHFKELEANWVRRIFQTQLNVNIIDATTPAEVKFEIFQRINTGGSPLNAQEIRHCIMKGEVRDLLKRMASQPEFGRILPESLRQHPRMIDREMVLKFLAFMQPNAISEYASEGQMETFLMKAAERLGTMSGGQRVTLAQAFTQAMVNAFEVFGEEAFRKPSDEGRIKPINRSLFESWGVALASYPTDSLRVARASIVEAFHRALEDQTYMESISIATANSERVRRRFEVATRILRECVA